MLTMALVAGVCGVGAPAPGAGVLVLVLVLEHDHHTITAPLLKSIQVCGAMAN